MPQTSRTASYIIIKAFHLIGEFSPDKLPSGSEMAEGLDLLNDLLDSFAADQVLIPFIRELDFTLQVGQNKYSVSNIVPADVNAERIVALDFVNLIRDQNSYPVSIISRAELFNSWRTITLQSRPTSVILIRDNLETTLQFYPIPEFNYDCKVRAKFMLDHLELFDNLDELPPYYFRFLRYALGRELKQFYPSSNWSVEAEETYQNGMKKITANSDINLAIVPSGILMHPYGAGYGSIAVDF